MRITAEREMIELAPGLLPVRTEVSMSAVTERSSAILTALADAVGEANVITDADVMESYRKDMQPLAPAGTPLAVVRPASTEEVVRVVKACSVAGVPLVARGAGSGMTGSANSLDGAVTLLTSRMNNILEVSTEESVAVVQPGVITLALKNAVADLGLFYAPDPTSSDWCTIGGNIANGSGGPCGAKYGVTADAVLALEVVLASGEILRTGRRTRKGVSGYDLTRLFVGSEGTLGIITEATLALRRRPAAVSTAVAVFTTVASAGRTVTDFVATGNTLSLLEIMDAACISAVEEHLGSSLLDDGTAAGAVLFAQCDADTHEGISAFEQAATDNGAELVYSTIDEEEGEMLMGHLHSLEAALEARGSWILHEVTVPRHRLAEIIDGAAGISDRLGVFVGVHGHAADGTVHPMIVVDTADEAQLRLAQLAYDNVLTLAVELGGTVTGEHGIGRMKQAYLANEQGPVGMSVHHAIKKALDPEGILNPGTMF